MRGACSRVEPNIYRYASGRWQVRLLHAGRRVKSSFPRATPIETVRAFVVAARHRLDVDARQAGEPTPARAVGTLEGDAPAFLAQIAGRSSIKSDTSHLRAWFGVVVDGVRLGALARPAWTARHVNLAIAYWQAMPAPATARRVRVEASTRRGKPLGAYERAAPATSGRVVATLTIRHRCRLLDDLFHTLDGATAFSPVADAKIPARSKRPPTVPAASVVVDALRELRTINAQSFGRFYVAATTGQRPCQVGRAEPADVDLDARTWLVRDAKGAPAHCITLDEPQVAAWRAFIAADAWGAFNTSQYGKHIHAAGWPVGIRPYAVRHALAVEAIRRGVSLGDVQALLGHTDPTTTRIYAPFVIERQRAVSTALASYLGDVSAPRLVKGGSDR